mgnify:CR=1 FL=1
MEHSHPPIDVLVNAVGAWNTVRVDQPFQGLQRQGWDVRFHRHPFDLNTAIRPHSLVIWQRPVPESWEQWRYWLQGIRRRGCLLLVEWDDHPDLFPDEVRQRLEQCRNAHLRLAHALQCSSPRLAHSLRALHHLPLVVENAIDPIPPLNLTKHSPGQPLRVFLGNLNRLEEHRRMLPGLLQWLQQEPELQLVSAGPTGLEGQVPAQRLERHPLLPYADYRRVLASCQLALLPLQRGVPQACKTPIKWLEAAAEGTAVVAGPELYAPWLAANSRGVWAASPEQVVQEAQRLAADLPRRQALVAQAHSAALAHSLPLQLAWRAELYRHLWRLRNHLDAQLLQQWPELRQA